MPSNLTALHSHWEVPDRTVSQEFEPGLIRRDAGPHEWGHYTPGQGIVSINGKGTPFKVGTFDVDGTSTVGPKRAYSDIGEANANIQFLFGPGWGETSAQSDGSIAPITLEQALEMGLNPAFLGTNTLGRGTPEYWTNRDQISGVSLKRRLEDAAAYMAGLIENGLIRSEADIVLIGHSMGFLDVMKMYEYLLKERKDVADRVIGVVSLMGTPDHPRALADPTFLTGVIDFVPAAILQTATRNGVLRATKEEYGAKMFAPKAGTQLEQAHLDRAVGDSARSFVNISTNFWKTIFKKVYDEMMAKRVPLHIVGSENDQLISPRILKAQQRKAQNRKVDAHYHDLSQFPHAIPFDIDAHFISAEYRRVLENIIKDILIDLKPSNRL